MKPRVFVSVPDDRHLNARRRGLKRAILGFIGDEGFDLAGFEPEQWGTGIPLNRDVWTVDKADKLIRRCDGAVVLALARLRVQVLGQDDEGLPDARGIVSAVPTPYNHLEGALAIAQKLPVLVLMEEDMDRVGIFDCGIKPATVPSDADDSWVRSPSLRAHVQAWAEQVRARRDVFLGYCSKADSCAAEIRDYLERKGYSVLDWARDFRPAGPTIIEEIENAARLCRCAVFLFTGDDEVDERARAKASFDAIPRDNVLLEAGYFTQARGKERVAIVRESGAKMPADLGGIIYLPLEDRRKLRPVKQGLEKFLKTAL